MCVCVSERVRACVRVCHVTFGSSVNVVDYFLRDQNWLPRIGPPSIFKCTNRTQGEAMRSKDSWEGERASLPELVTMQSGNSLLNLSPGGD